MENRYSEIIKKLLLKSKSGFSIGEVLLAAFIMVVALTVVVSLIASSMNHSMDSRNHIIASELAQEGAELVRNLRDNNLANEKPSFDDFPDSSSNCRIDMNATILSCSLSNFELKYAGNFYVHGGSGSATKFSRRIVIGNYETTGRKIFSIVSWGTIPPSILTNCTVTGKCAYVESILSNLDN